MEKVKQNINYKKILIAIFIIACLFRVVFISFSGIDHFQYDVGVGNLNSAEDYDRILERDEEVFLPDRHLDYILKIYETGKLPDSNSAQQYHPPLYHVISAIWLKVLDIFQFSTETRLESLQIPTCIYSIITLFIIWKILEELEIDDKLKTIVIAICGFHPIFVYMAGLINNDTLLTMFSMWSILYILKWYKNPSYKNAIILAIIIGLGTLTKTSMLVNLMITAIVVFIKFLEILYNAEYRKLKEIIFQGIIFLLISLPLILCFPIRNYILFEQPPFSIHEAAEWLYVGNDNMLNRFGIFNKEILDNTLKYDNQNVLSYVIKSAIVFETNREVVFGTTFLKIISIILIIVTFLSIIKLIASKDRRSYILIISYAIWIIFFISFNYQMPNSCTMHARYIITAIAISVICLTKIIQEKNNKKIANLMMGISTVFSLSSIMVILLNIL